MPVPACQPSSIWGGKKLSQAACSIGPRDWKWNRASWPKRKNWLNKQIWLFLALKPKPLQTWMPVSTLQNIFITATDSICFMGLLCSHLKSCSKSSQPTMVFGQSRKHATIASLLVCFQLLKWPCHRITRQLEHHTNSNSRYLWPFTQGPWGMWPTKYDFCNTMNFSWVRIRSSLLYIKRAQFGSAVGANLLAVYFLFSRTFLLINEGFGKLYYLLVHFVLFLHFS